MIALHNNARTTTAIRAEIAASTEATSALDQRFSITEQTVYKWKKREVFTDRFHKAHRLQIQLISAQESVVVHLRGTLASWRSTICSLSRANSCSLSLALGARPVPQALQRRKPQRL